VIPLSRPAAVAPCADRPHYAVPGAVPAMISEVSHVENS
jgi:hypothetical protein